MANFLFAAFSAIVFYAGYIFGSIHPDLLTITSTEISKATEICVNANSKISKMSSLKVLCENDGEFKYEQKN